MAKKPETQKPVGPAETPQPPETPQDRSRQPERQGGDAPVADRGEHGEGNYVASKQYNEATKRFVRSGKVERAAHEAAPRDRQEEEAMRRAEEVGREHAKEEDPALRGTGGDDTGR